MKLIFQDVKDYIESFNFSTSEFEETATYYLWDNFDFEDDDEITADDLEDIISKLEATIYDLSEMDYYNDCFCFLSENDITDWEEAIDAGNKCVSSIANYYFREKYIEEINSLIRDLRNL